MPSSLSVGCFGPVSNRGEAVVPSVFRNCTCAVGCPSARGTSNEVSEYGSPFRRICFRFLANLNAPLSSRVASLS